MSDRKERRELKAALTRLRESQYVLRASADIAPPDPPSHHWRWEKARTTARMEMLRIAREARTA